MRVLLRNRQTGFYYAGWNMWVGSPDVAYECGEVSRATDLADQEIMPPMEMLEVVLDYDDPKCQVAFPVRPDWQREWHRAQGLWPRDQRAA